MVTRDCLSNGDEDEEDLMIDMGCIMTTGIEYGEPHYEEFCFCDTDK